MGTGQSGKSAGRTLKAVISGLMAVSCLALLSGCEQNKETGPTVVATGGEAPEVAAPVPAATENPALARPLASFEGKDADGDGKVTVAEYASAAQTMFRMMDADKDGAVTVDELGAARDAIGAGGNISAEKVVAANDSDNNGKLTLSEWMAGANAQFSALDGNHDSVLDGSERKAVDDPARSPITAPRANNR